jgi:hypothetical protein
VRCILLVKKNQTRVQLSHRYAFSGLSACGGGKKNQETDKKPMHVDLRAV